MAFDPTVALRLINNERLRHAQGWCEFRDLNGALAGFSDAPIPGLNCLEGFTTDERRIDALLDVGFALLRALDRAPAVKVTLLDRPKTLAKKLAARRLKPAETSVTMVYEGSGLPSAVDGVIVRRAGPEELQAFAQVHGTGTPWVRRLSMTSGMHALHEPGNSLYLGYIEGEAAGTLHMLQDSAAAGLYAVATIRRFRRHGVATALIARAVHDAREAGAGIIGLRTDAAGDARRLFETLGFRAAFETVLWVAD
jgi:GNAT superfamily N-acetyltransferase